MATKPAKTKLADALKSVAITGAPTRDLMPSIMAVLPFKEIFPPILAISCTCMNLLSKTFSVTVAVPLAIELRAIN